MSEFISLTDAVSRFVRPGMHLNFASTPSRSNAAVREVARQFQSSRPEFVLSATGFHSTLHLLGLLRLGRRYIGCFFGDNYPSPRPSPLYAELLREGAELEHWSLLSYVAALRAAALGHHYALTRSLRGSELGARLSSAGKFVEFPDPQRPGESLGMVAALSPDLVFLHALAADRAGRVAFFPPHAEGFHGAWAAKVGVIVSVERVLDAGGVRHVPQLVHVPPERVLAICEAPYGAHPQPLHFPSAALPVQGYRDDFEHYELWRRMTLEPSLFTAFVASVLNAPDGEEAYRRFVGSERLESLRVAASRHSEPPCEPHDVFTAPDPSALDLTSSERMVLLAARAIVRRARNARLSSVLAGIGQSFSAARLASVLAEASGLKLELSIETGMSGVDPWNCHPFLLSQQTMASATQLSSVEAVLGALTCGAQNRCLGVLGAAQVDEAGQLNSSFSGGELLVGSGGANDIASAASEVIVLCPAAPKRLVRRVEFVTSPGHRVRAIATDCGVLERSSSAARWSLTEALDAPKEAARSLREKSAFEFDVPSAPFAAAPASPLELRFLRHLRTQLGSTATQNRRAS